MLILAFDTSGAGSSVALLEGPRIVAERSLEAGHRSAQTLAPAIAELLGQQTIEPGKIALVATTIGPGSFTGLRVGITTAKTFAYAVGANVLGISTLEAIAHRVPSAMLAGQTRDVYAVLDAQRQELFVGHFRRTPSQGLVRVESDQIVGAEAWLAALTRGAVVTGCGINRFEDRLAVGVVAAPAALREPSAAIVGQLAWRDYSAGRRDDLWKLAPQYLRPSYAEEKAAKK